VWYASCHHLSIQGVFKEDKLAIPFRRIPLFLPFFIIIAFLYGCGGAGGTSDSADTVTYPAKILSWSPPSQYIDGTPLNPVTDLDRFEIYIKEDGIFSDTDNEMATVSAIDPGTGQPATSFNLANLSPFLSQGVTYYVSIRTVALNGMKSGFSPGATFSF
jgi:hypothetical protein